MTIGTVAEKAGVGVETIRYYQRRGLIVEPRRRSSTFRQYPEEAVARLRFIKRAQHLGFSLKEIKELLSLRLSGSTSRQDVRARTEAKIDELDDKIKALRDMKKALKGLIASCCAANGNESDCPILEALNED